MIARSTMVAASLLALAALLAGCDDDDDSSNPSPTGGRSGTGGSAGGEGESPLVPCLDRPDQLERPPAGRLPCDLLPPGFGQ